MGALISRQNRGVEEVDISSVHQYKYPPRSGNYFASHFIMGGERFDTPQPESYLFGENSDLNFLGSKPAPFPYPPPHPNEPIKTLKCLVNIRKESLRFVRSPTVSTVDKFSDWANEDPKKRSSFNVEFTFDCDVKCAITIYYFCTEEISNGNIAYVSRDPTLVSETYRYNRGANQQFCQMAHIFDPAKYPEEDLLYDVDREVIPVAIHCKVDEGPESMRQSHTTIATIERASDGTFVLKALKQKLFVDGLCYLLQEIYGIENKNVDRQVLPDDAEDNGSECVICMCDVRDTLILPCRHLCLCNACADSLRYQANNCPICRAPFRALLQVRALQKSGTTLTNVPPDSHPVGNNSAPATLLSSSVSGGAVTATLGSVTVPVDSTAATLHCENVPPGYEAVSLIEALNGPFTVRRGSTLNIRSLVGVGAGGQQDGVDAEATVAGSGVVGSAAIVGGSAIGETGRPKRAVLKQTHRLHHHRHRHHHRYHKHGQERRFKHMGDGNAVAPAVSLTQPNDANADVGDDNMVGHDDKKQETSVGVEDDDDDDVEDDEEGDEEDEDEDDEDESERFVEKSGQVERDGVAKKQLQLTQKLADVKEHGLNTQTTRCLNAGTLSEHSKDTVSFVNEKTGGKKSFDSTSETNDDDSDGEKLSPLLCGTLNGRRHDSACNSVTMESIAMNTLSALNMVGVVNAIDDTDDCDEEEEETEEHDRMMGGVAKESNGTEVCAIAKRLGGASTPTSTTKYYAHREPTLGSVQRSAVTDDSSSDAAATPPRYLNDSSSQDAPLVVGRSSSSASSYTGSSSNSSTHQLLTPHSHRALNSEI